MAIMFTGTIFLLVFETIRFLGNLNLVPSDVEAINILCFTVFFLLPVCLVYAKIGGLR